MMDTSQNSTIQRDLKIDARSSTNHFIGGDQHNHYHAASTQQYDPQILEKLRPTDMDPYGRPRCLEGTRTSAIQFITDWAFNTDTSRKLLWIYGLAGIGKSTISSTIADRFDEMNRLGAFLFFDRDVAERSDPASVIRTLAYQIALSHPLLGQKIASVLEKYPKISISPPNLQFQRLFVEPLTSIYGEDSSPILLIIDALDECGTSNTRAALLEVLAERVDSLPANVRFLVISRPERDIVHALGSNPRILEFEFDILLDNNVHDISAYIRYQLAQIKKHTYHLASKTVWPTEAEVRQLVERASGLFIWASTALQFINGYDPQKRLEVILSGTALNGAENALDALYRTALEAAGRWDDEDFISDFRAVIGMILALRKPLSSTGIDLLLDSNHSSCVRIIKHLSCVIRRDQTVRLLHPSFGDFLRAPSRNLRDIWSFENPDQKVKMAMYMLRHLCSTLRRNMCNMTLSADVDGEKMLSDDVTYACLFWVDHICAIENDTLAIMKDLDAFIFAHLLHWFEAMSILKRSRSSITMLDDLYNWLSTHYPSFPITELVSDAISLAQNFASTLEEHPLLVYHSALPFAPRSSAVCQAFNSNISCSVISCGFQQSWPSYSLILKGHKGPVIKAVFSPDGRSITSSSVDGTVRVWDAKVGTELFPPLRHADTRYVAFSFNGLRIHAVSYFGLLKMWDVMSGVEFLPSVQFDDFNEYSVISSGAFSADGMKFVWSTNDGYIHMMHLDPNVQPRQLSAFYGRDLNLLSVSFSPNEERIVSGFDNGSIQVYNAVSGLEMISTLRNHPQRVFSVSFSPNGTSIVFVSEHVHVWSVESGLEILSFRAARDRHAISSLVFSPDGAIILSGSYDGTIRVWDAMLGVEIQDVLRQHEGSISSLAFSRDGRDIVSASDDCTVRVWKMSTDIFEDTTPNVQKDRATISCVALSPDASKIVSGSTSGTISFWDANLGTELCPPLRGHKEEVLSIVFSPDGTRIFSCSEDCTIRGFDVTTRRLIFPVIQNKRYLNIRSIAVCPLGNRIVSGDSKGAIRTWDAKLGIEIRFPKTQSVGQNSDTVLSVVFSPDGAIIASASRYRIKIWDSNSGALLIRIKTSCPLEPLQHMAFSPDGSILYRQIENDVHIWSITEIEDIDGRKVTSDFDLCSRLSSGIVVTEEGWLVDPKTMRTFSQLPSSLRFQVLAFHCNSESLAIGTQDGHVYVMHFSSEVSQSPETRPMEGSSRLNVINHGAFYHLEGDSDSD